VPAPLRGGARGRRGAVLEEKDVAVGSLGLGALAQRVERALAACGWWWWWWWWLLLLLLLLRFGRRRRRQRRQRRVWKERCFCCCCCRCRRRCRCCCRFRRLCCRPRLLGRRRGRLPVQARGDVRVSKRGGAAHSADWAWRVDARRRGGGGAAAAVAAAGRAPRLFRLLLLLLLLLRLRLAEQQRKGVALALGGGRVLLRHWAVVLVVLDGSDRTAASSSSSCVFQVERTVGSEGAHDEIAWPKSAAVRANGCARCVRFAVAPPFRTSPPVDAGKRGRTAKAASFGLRELFSQSSLLV